MSFTNGIAIAGERPCWCMLKYFVSIFERDRKIFPGYKMICVCMSSSKGLLQYALQVQVSDTTMFNKVSAAGNKKI